jgi:hypothetical protein
MKALSRYLAPLRAAANRRFGRLLAPVMDYFVKMESREDRSGAIRRATPAASARPSDKLWGERHNAASYRPQKGDL